MLKASKSRYILKIQNYYKDSDGANDCKADNYNGQLHRYSRLVILN